MDSQKLVACRPIKESLVRTVLFVAAILIAASSARAATSDLTALFDAVQKVGTESELRGDIADRLGFGDHPLAIKDLVIVAKGVQHAVNAFTADGKSYLLFDSHLYAPEVYIFVRGMDGALASGIHGQRFQPINSTVDMIPSDGPLVVEPEETFWRAWLAAGARPPAN